MYSEDPNAGSSISLNESSKENSIIFSRYKRGIDVFLALVLIIAAVLKTHQNFSHSSPLIPGLMSSKIVLTFLIEVEILLGIWLIIGGFRRIQFIVALVCFATFTI